MFSKERPLTKTSQVKALKDLIATENPDDVLKNPKYQKIISQIKSSLYLTNTEFASLANSLILRTIKYCQKLPESSMYYANLGGLVDLALNRSEAALNLMQHTMIIETSPSEEQKLWLYALFSAAMLQGLGKLYTDYKVNLYDKNGQFIKSWQPLIENLIDNNAYYDYELLKGDDYNLKNSITPLIARHIMPKTGFEKIMSNSEIFATWLALLREDKEAAGPLAAILDRANAIAIQKYIHDFLLKFGRYEGQENRLGAFSDTNPENKIDKEKILGAEFIAWITESLANGKIIINQEPLVISVTEASVILHPSALDVYMQEHKKLKNRVAIQKAFLSWNMHLLTDAAVKALSETNKASTTIQINTALLPETVKIYNQKTDKITSVSTLNLILNLQSYSQINSTKLGLSMNKLNAFGQWVSGEENVSKPINQRTQRF